jgi:hypothetical protein
MLLDNVIKVNFDIPPLIREGMRNGQYLRRGGVIQDTAGQVIAWLRESGGLQDVLASNPVGAYPSNIASQISSISAGMPIMLGMQGLTLGVTVIGFALLNNKLNVVNSKLDLILTDIKEIKEDLNWLDRRNDIALFAKLISALENAQWATSTGRLERVCDSRLIFCDAQRHYQLLLMAMISEKRAYKYPEIYGNYYNQFALATAAKIQCDLSLDGPSAAVACIKEGGNVANQLNEDYLKPLRSFPGNEWLISIAGDPKQKKSLANVKAEIIETCDVLSGYGVELSFCNDKQIPLPDWKNIGQSKKEPAILVIEPKETYYISPKKE